MSTERAEFIATLNSGAVDTALATTRAKVQDLGGGLSTLRSGLERVDGAASRTVQQGLGSLQFALGKTAGEAAGVVNAIGDVAGALATGGVFGLALAASTAALVAAYKEWEALEKKQREVSSARGGVDTGDAAGRLQRRKALLGDQADDARDRSAAAAKEFEAEQQRNREEADRIRREVRVDEDKKAVIKKEANAKATEAARKQNAELRALAISARAVEDRESAAERKAWLDGENEAADRRIALEEKTAEQELKIWRETKQERIDIAKKAAEAEQALTLQIATEGLGIAVSAAQQGLDAYITGQEDGLALVAAGIARQTGTAVIGHGISTAAAGIGQLASTGGVLGAGALATGLGLIAGGLTMGGIGTGIEHVTGGGTVGKPLPEKDKVKSPTTDRGVSGGPSRRSGEGVGGKFTQINYYAVGGPQPEESARAVAQLNRLSRRRRMT